MNSCVRRYCCLAPKNIEFDMDLPKVYFYGNEQLLDQVWVNILDNAIKHSPLESSIHICLCSKEQELSVSITDEGRDVRRRPEACL